MTKEELIKLSRENLRTSKQGSLCECYDEAFIKGYELSEKRIAELEHQLTHRNCLDCSNHSSKLRMRTLELEKENAELKETLKTYNGCGDWDNDFHTCRVYLQHEELQMYIHQLTKAKEIIREFMKYEINEYDGSLEIHFEELKKQAEQFLKIERWKNEQKAKGGNICFLRSVQKGKGGKDVL